MLSTLSSSNTCSLYSLGGILAYIKSPALYRDLVLRDPDQFPFPLISHWPGGIMLIASSEQEKGTALGLLGRHLHVRGGETNPTKLEGLSTSAKSLDAQGNVEVSLLG